MTGGSERVVMQERRCEVIGADTGRGIRRDYAAATPVIRTSRASPSAFARDAKMTATGVRVGRSPASRVVLAEGGKTVVG